MLPVADGNFRLRRPQQAAVYTPHVKDTFPKQRHSQIGGRFLLYSTASDDVTIEIVHLHAQVGVLGLDGVDDALHHMTVGAIFPGSTGHPDHGAGYRPQGL